MASRKRTVELEVVVDDNKARADLKRIADETTKTGRQFSSMGTMVKAGLAAFGAREMIQGLANLDALKTRMEANEQRADTVFGNMADDVRAWADEQNEAFGIGENALLGLASNMQDLLVPMGFAREEAKGLTEQTLLVANALDDWKGGTLGVENATDRIIKSMLGEREGLVELGIKISEADVKRALAEKGLDNLTGAALEQAKAQVTLELIMAKSADAMAAYADRSDSAVAANKRLKASTEDAKETAAGFFGAFLDEGKEVFGDLATIGGAAGDAIDKLSGKDGGGGFAGLIEKGARWAPILGDIVRALDAGAEAVDGNTEATEKNAKATEEGLKVAEDADKALRNKLIPAVEELAEEQSAASKMADRHREALKRQTDALYGMGDPIRAFIDGMEDITEAEQEAIDAWAEDDRLMDAFIRLRTEGIDPTSSAAQHMFDKVGLPPSLQAKLIAQWAALEARLEAMVLEIPVSLPTIRGPIFGKSGTVIGWREGERQSFHEGGVVPGTPGADVPIMAQGGETVIRRADTRTGGGVSTINHITVTNPSSVFLAELMELRRRGVR